MNRVAKRQQHETKLALIGMLILLCLHGTATMTVAQVGITAFTFQGTLEDGGSPANDDYDFQFVIFDGPDPFFANPIGPAVNETGVSVEDGVFFVTLDFGEGVFNGDMRWLQILVRKSGTTDPPTPLSPIHKLTPVPYATLALNADNLDGLDSSGFVQTEADPTIGAALKTSCQICLGHSDNDVLIPERQQCFGLNDTGGLDLNNSLKLTGTVNGDDQLWLWIECP